MGGAAVRTPSGAAAVRGPYGGTAYRAPGYGGGAVYCPGVGYGVAAGAAAGVAVGAAAGAAVAASTYPSCYNPPYYCYPRPTPSRPLGDSGVAVNGGSGYPCSEIRLGLLDAEPGDIEGRQGEKGSAGSQRT